MEESLKIDRMSFAKKRQRDMESFSPDRDYPQLARKQAERISELESEIAALRRERDDALRAAEIVRQLATPPISDADVEAAVAEAMRVSQEIEGEH